MDRLFILDAVNYLFRSYYGIGPMTNDKGQSTSALFGFIRSAQKLIRDFSADHLVCVFDGPDNKKSRQAVYADYKMHRKGAPEDLFPQFEWAYEFCEKRGISTLCVEGVEADDAMASVAVWAEKKGTKVYLCSSDKDLMQLVSPQIFMLHLHKDNLLIDEGKVKELYGVRPDQMLDFLAIMGDASDNIPGLEGFGPKTAATLLQEFDTLDNLLANPEKVKGEKKQEVLKTQKGQALMSRELATLDMNVPIPHDEDFYRIKQFDKSKLIDFFHRMNFNSLLKELSQEAPAASNHKKKTAQIDKHDYRLIDEEDGLDHLLMRLSKEKEVGLDTETTDIHPFLAKLVGVGFSFQPGEAWYIPLNGKIGEEKVLKALRHFFSHAKCSFFGHNIKYDLHILGNEGIELRQICFDTLLASYLINPQVRRHNLDDLVLEAFKKVKIPIESLIGKGKNEISMRDVPIDKVKDYCCEDVDYTTRLKLHFEEDLQEKKLDHLLRDIELPLLPILAKMERTGIYLDKELLESQGRRINQEIQVLKEAIFQEVGAEFNLNSPKQLGEVLFVKKGLSPPGRSKTEFSTSADVLEVLAEESPFVQLILDYRGLEKLRSTYIEALPLSIHPKTGRIHCTFNQSGAATGRLSCQDPNLQNIPVRTKEGMAIRSCFKPKGEGFSFIGADYSQIELRLLAHFSEDPALLHAFQTGGDIHQHTASIVFNVPLSEVTSEMRSRAKTVNFGIIYGQGPFGLSRQLHIPMREASEFIKTYFERYPKVLGFLESCKESAKKTGVSKTLTGRLRPIPEIANQNPSIRAGAERLAFNTPLQGTAADLIKMAMIEIDREIEKRNLKGKMILQIHDELIFEVPDEEISLFKVLVKDKMEHVLKLSVPIEVHIAVGKNWAEC
ncbi:MAG: DNA polymerase I [Chlamydiae bacterium RIFCSPHIGHO2_12_FULL_49_9]|nr:MAG: DNA polymerase I [Chlamydiae bacterium RIFCSPHIGHO2_12_FULL_49_9]